MISGPIEYSEKKSSIGLNNLSMKMCEFCEEFVLVFLLAGQPVMLKMISLSIFLPSQKSKLWQFGHDCPKI